MKILALEEKYSDNKNCEQKKIIEFQYQRQKLIDQL